MRLLILTLSLFVFSVQAQEEKLSFKNVREGKSYYSKFLNDQVVKQILKKTSRQVVVEIYQDALKKQDANKLCAYDLNRELNSTLESRSIDTDLKGIIFILRQENEIDDVLAKILLTAHAVKRTQVITKDEEERISPENNQTTKSQLELIASFEKRFAKGNCLDEAYRNFHAELLKVDKEIKSYQLEALNLQALQEKRISEELYLTLEQARLNEMETGSLSLASYQQKVRTLRTQYPLRDSSEKSDFTSLKVKKMKSSRRQRLFENYTDLQIIMMGNVIKKLRARLEYDSVEISGYRSGVLQETIALDPMERFRFAIKALRKEMSLLTLNTYFAGRSPDYMDLMVASYEIGIIQSSELNVVASLEEVWNPKKTFWDKAGVWIKAFSTVATIVIPPPYGFIPALVLVVIEATAKKSKNSNANDPTVLF
jgi:hypothetical protein